MNESLVHAVSPVEPTPGPPFRKREFAPGTPAASCNRSKLPVQPIDQLQTVRHRNALATTRQAVAQGRLNVGFLGGSITAGWEHNWPGPVTTWLNETFPGLWVTAENAAIGATGSDSGCLRADREIIATGCHLTFVEYAVNDYEQSPERRGRTREGLIRKLLAAGRDVVLVYTFRQEMYADMAAGRVPASIAEFEVLARHYGLGSIWVGLHALNEVRSGRMTWTEWLPDGLHPTHRGSWSYAQAVIDFLRTELQSAHPQTNPPALPAPLFPLNWQSVSELPLTEVSLQGPWLLKRAHEFPHIEQVLETHTPGARMKIPFTGRGLILLLDAGRMASECNYRIDAGEWQTLVRERPAWVGDRGMLRPWVVAEELVAREHIFEMEVTHGDRPDCRGTECRLALIGVL